MLYGLGDTIQGLSENQCEGQKVKCTECGKTYFRCHAHSRCPSCGEEKFISEPWWYGMPIPNVVQGKVLLDGRKIIPRYFVEVNAHVNPDFSGDSLARWFAAERWFKDNGGWKMVEDEEWYSYSKRVEKNRRLFFAKEE